MTPDRDRVQFLLLNIGHFVDHFFTLIFATVAALALSRDWHLGYAELLKYATPGFFAFGLFSLPAGWLSDRFGARRVASLIGTVLVLGYVLIACHVDLVGSIVIVLTRGLYNTLIPVMVMERVSGGYLSSQASYSTWRDFGAAVGPLTAPWLFLTFTQSYLFAALAVIMALGVFFCLARRA